MIYKCENCKNRNNCCENKEQYERTCELVGDFARTVDKIPAYRCYYSLTIKCDYFVDDKETYAQTFAQPSEKGGEFVETGTLVETGQWITISRKLHEVVIADDNIFVACPLKYSKKEDSMIVKYSKPKIYANQSSINTLSDLDISIC